MRVVCKSNRIITAPKHLRHYAYTQDEDGILDITPGRTYEVYGFRKYAMENFYLVHTDSINAKLPWWMPASLYEQSDDPMPSTWLVKRYGKNEDDEIIAPFVVLWR